MHRFILDEPESDSENIPPDGEGKNGGRPKVDYKQKFRSLERRVKRSGIDLTSREPFAKQLSGGNGEGYEIQKKLKSVEEDLENARKEIAQLKQKLVAKKVSRKKVRLPSRLKPYSQKSERNKRMLRNAISLKVIANSNKPTQETATFIKDMFHFSVTKEALRESLVCVLEDPKVAAVMQKDIINKEVYRASKDEMNRTRDFVAAKKMQISKAKKQQLNKAKLECGTPIGSKIKVYPITMPYHTKNIDAARRHLRRSFPLVLPTALKHITVDVEHALVDTVAMVKCGLASFYCNEQLHPNWLWFFDSRAGDGYKVNHVELSTFFDSTPLGKDGDSCTGLYLRFINAAGLIQRPEFTYILYLVKTKETSQLSQEMLRMYSNHLMRIIRGGLTLDISGFSDERTIPKSDILLNGSHFITFGNNNFAGDGKATLWAGGCKSAISSFTPEWKHHQEEMVNPHFPVTHSQYISLPFRRIFAQQVDQFQQQQRNHFKAAIPAIKKNYKLSETEKRKQLLACYNKFLIKGVSDFARELKTGCVHFQPFEIAEETCPCPLHMDTNEYLRVIEHIVRNCAALTLAHGYAPGFDKCIGKGKNVSVFPDISKADPQAPLVLALNLLRDVHLKKLADYFERQFLPSVDAPQLDPMEFDVIGDVEEIFGGEKGVNSLNQEVTHARLIGESIKKISPHLSELSLCAKPPNGLWKDGQPETAQEVEKRIVTHTYVHLLRTLSASLSAWIMVVFRDEHGIQMLGDLYVLLVHRYRLHKSYNSFLFAQVSPYKIKRNMIRYRISPQKALNIGVYGKNESGEHKQKKVKEQYLKWTDRHVGWMLSLINQNLEVYLAGSFLFPDTCPEPVDLDRESTKSWDIRFGQRKTPENHCSACGATISASSPILRDALDGTHQCEMFMSFQMQEYWSQNFSYSSWSVSELFALFLKMSFSETYCEDCVRSAQLLHGLLFGLQEYLVW